MLSVLISIFLQLLTEIITISKEDNLQRSLRLLYTVPRIAVNLMNGLVTIKFLLAASPK